MSDKKAAEVSTAEVAAAEAEAIEDAITPAAPAKRSPGEQAAEDAELNRQEDVREAVAKANDAELPKLGGALKNPGLGR